MLAQLLLQPLGGPFCNFLDAALGSLAVLATRDELVALLQQAGAGASAAAAPGPHLDSGSGGPSHAGPIVSTAAPAGAGGGGNSVTSSQGGRGQLSSDGDQADGPCTPPHVLLAIALSIAVLAPPGGLLGILARLAGRAAAPAASQAGRRPALPLRHAKGPRRTLLPSGTAGWGPTAGPGAGTIALEALLAAGGGAESGAGAGQSSQLAVGVGAGEADGVRLLAAVELLVNDHELLAALALSLQERLRGAGAGVQQQPDLFASAREPGGVSGGGSGGSSSTGNGAMERLPVMQRLQARLGELVQALAAVHDREAQLAARRITRQALGAAVGQEQVQSLKGNVGGGLGWRCAAAGVLAQTGLCYDTWGGGLRQQVQPSAAGACRQPPLLKHWHRRPPVGAAPAHDAPGPAPRTLAAGG